MDLLTIGDVTIDLFMKIGAEHGLPETDGETPKICFHHGSKIPVEQFGTSIAGNSLNVAVGAKTLGLDTSIYAETGDDSNGERIIEELNEIGVNTNFIVQNEDTPTNMHSVIIYGHDRTIFSYHEKYSYNILNWPKPKYIYYTSMGDGFGGFQLSLIDYLNENPDIGVAFNPGSLQLKAGLESFRNILKYTNILFLNKEEAGMLVGKKPIEKIHIDLQKLGPSLTVITDGKNGSSAFDGNELIKLDIYTDSRPLVDKTGAGDAFSSGFLSALIYNKTLKEALAWGAVNSGSTIKEIGAINGLLNKTQMEKIVAQII